MRMSLCSSAKWSTLWRMRSAIELAASPRRRSKFSVVTILPISIGSRPHRFRAFTAIARVRRSIVGIRHHERFGNMRAHNVVRGQARPVSVGVAHAGDFVFSEVDTQGPLLSRILRQVQRATCKLCEPEETHPWPASTVGGKMLVEVGGAVFDDQWLGDWPARSGGGPCVHEVHQRLHIADRVVPGEADRCRVVRKMGDTHLAHRAQSPSSGGAVHRIDEPYPAVLRRRTDRLTERAIRRRSRERHTLPHTSDSHPPAVQGHSPREDWQLRERLRECVCEIIRIEMPLEEEHNVDRQVRDNGVAGIAADVEPLHLRWFHQLGRHRGLPSPVHDYEAAEFRRVGDPPEIHLLIGGRIGLDPEILQHRP